jgi:integrase
MTRKKAVSLVWYCKTPTGWTRFPVVIGGNNRVKLGYVMLRGALTHYPEGRFEIRTYVNRKAVYKRAGDNAADAMAAKTRQEHLEAARGSAGAAGVQLIEDTTRLILRKAALNYEEDAKQRGARDAAEVIRHVMDEFISVCGRTYVDEVTREDVFSFHKALRARGCGDRTVHNKHMRLRSFFKFSKLDYAAIIPPAPKYDSTLPTTYSNEEITKILKAADPYMTLAIELGRKCGLRDQEIQHLEWPDIDWANSTLRVTSKPHWEFRIKDSEERDIPIPASLLRTLKKRKALGVAGLLILPTGAGKPNGKLLRALKRLAKANGLNCGVCKGCKSKNAECQRWTLHKLRRTYCTMLLRSGFDVATVQRFMGHSDLESTMRYLAPASSSASQKAINAIKWD